MDQGTQSKRIMISQKLNVTQLIPFAAGNISEGLVYENEA